MNEMEQKAKELTEREHPLITKLNIVVSDLKDILAEQSANKDKLKPEEREMLKKIWQKQIEEYDKLEKVSIECAVLCRAVWLLLVSNARLQPNE